MTRQAAVSIYTPFTWPVRVYWEDTDAGGVVYHAGYVCYLERARSEWLRSLGIGQTDLRDRHDVLFAVRGMKIEFRAPARLDDLLQVETRLATRGGASLRFEQRILRDGALLLEAEVRVACISASRFRPCPIPDGLLDA